MFIPLRSKHASTWPGFCLACILVLVGAAGVDAAEKKAKAGKATKGPARWEETIRKFEAEDRATPPPKGAVLLVGGSNARRWTDVGEYFPQEKIINRGFGGAQLTEVLHFADRIVIPYRPKLILLNAGANDLGAGRSPGEVRDAARAFVRKVKAAMPETRIGYIGLPPIMRLADSPERLTGLRSVNAMLAEIAREENQMTFIDIVPHFLGQDGKPRADLYVADGVHFSPKGYAVVARLLRDKVGLK